MVLYKIFTIHNYIKFHESEISDMIHIPKKFIKGQYRDIINTMKTLLQYKYICSQQVCVLLS